MGYVDPVDLAHAMTADGFNVRGVNLPLIGQPVETPDQGLAKQPRNEKLTAAQHKWQSVWGGARGGPGAKRRAAPTQRSISVLETRTELDEFNRRLDQAAESAPGADASAAGSGAPGAAGAGAVARDSLPHLSVGTGARQGTYAPQAAVESVVGKWLAEVERRDSSPSKCKFELRLSMGKKGRVTGAGRQCLNGKQWVCRVSSVKLDAQGGIRLQLVFGPKDKEEWFGKLVDGGTELEAEKTSAAEEVAAESGEERGGVSRCYMMQARTKDWLSPPFRLTRSSDDAPGAAAT